MFVMYPDANIPMVQLSIKENYNPSAHIALGRAIAPLRDQGVLIIGSGLSFHNMRAFFTGPSGVNTTAARAFDDWLHEQVVEKTGEERTKALLDWASAPGARYAHPQEDHFVPLHVAGIYVCVSVDVTSVGVCVNGG